ncbi:MAG TPA: hypothetical protein VGP92_09820 [Acidimicrobiia bacterium]|nr:hypothetical protein [Acidimicrobiia bacterium]
MLGGHVERTGAKRVRERKQPLPGNPPGEAKWRVVKVPPEPGQSRVGICCSGGGIRSASFNLGALQALRHTGALQDAEYLAGVSGGGYTTIAHAIAAKYSDPGTVTAEDPLYGHLSVEEEHLRNHTDYLAPGARGRVWMALHIIGGFVVNSAVLLAMLFVVARPLGWIVRGLQPGLARGGSAHRVRALDVSLPVLVTAVVIGVLVFATLTMRLSWELRRTGEPVPERARRTRLVVATATGVVSYVVLLGLWWLSTRSRPASIPENHLVADTPRLIAVGVPFAVALLSVFVLYLFERAKVRLRDKPLQITRQVSYFAVLFGAAAISVIFVLPALIVAIRWIPDHTTWLSEKLGLSSGANATQKTTIAALLAFGGAAVGGISSVARLARGKGRILVPFVAVLAGPVMILVVTALFANHAADWGPLHERHLWVLYAVLGGLLVVQLFFDANAWAPHRFYRERLWSGYAIKRVKGPGDGLAAQFLDFDDEEGSESDRDEFQLSELRSMKPKHAERMTEDEVSERKLPELIVCCTLNVAGDCVPPGRNGVSFTFAPKTCRTTLSGPVDLEDYEDWSSQSVSLTLPALMAVSGAALAPEMGKSGRPGARMLFTLLNVRLGVWLPNPVRADIWKTESRDTGGSLAHRVARGLRRRTLKPGPFGLIREALGFTSVNSRYAYVSDGGHWENLGLVELLRRGCTLIYCVDCAGDGVSTFETIGEAIALARTELGVEITLDPSALMPNEAGRAASGHVIGHYRFADANRTPGVLVFLKATIFDDLPWDVLAYAEHDKRFPCHSTVLQIFDGKRFEAYRALGEATAAHAADGLVLHIAQCDNPACIAIARRVLAGRAQSPGAPPADFDLTPTPTPTPTEPSTTDFADHDVRL